MLYGAFSLFDFGLPEYVFRGREKSESVPTRIESDGVCRMEQTTLSSQVSILFHSVSKLSLLCFWGNFSKLKYSVYIAGIMQKKKKKNLIYSVKLFNAGDSNSQKLRERIVG